MLSTHQIKENNVLITEAVISTIESQAIKNERILLYAEGDFSYTLALIKEISEKILSGERKNTLYEIIATELMADDFAKEKESTILGYISDNKLNSNIKYKQISGINCETDDAVKARIISGKFERIILNFPTCNIGWDKTVFEKTLLQIKRNDLLEQSGQVEFRYWVEPGHCEEDKYRLGRAQKSTGFILKSRSVVDMLDLSKRGYNHVLDQRLGRKKDAINHLALCNVYTLNNDGTKSKELEKIDFNEISDEEDVIKLEGADAMPLRELTSLSFSARNFKWNVLGNTLTRDAYRLVTYSKKSYEEWIKDILENIQCKNYKKAEVVLKILIESGKHDFSSLEKDDLFRTKIIDQFISDYNTLLQEKKIDENTHENMPKYHQITWYAKLKVLCGLKIPPLPRQYKI